MIRNEFVLATHEKCIIIKLVYRGVSMYCVCGGCGVWGVGCRGCGCVWVSVCVSDLDVVYLTRGICAVSELTL